MQVDILEMDSEKLLKENKKEVAMIKDEYVIKEYNREVVIQCISSRDKRKLEKCEQDADSPEKKRRASKKLKGQNKVRPNTYREAKEKQFCPWSVDIQPKKGNGERVTPAESEEPGCQYGENCGFRHDTAEYLKTKPEDISDTCYVYSVRGHCPRGITCRFGKCHLTEAGENLRDEERLAAWKNDPSTGTVNTLTKDLLISLRKRKYDFTRSQNAIDYIDKTFGGKKMDKKVESKENVAVEERTGVESKEVEDGTKSSETEGLRSNLEVTRDKETRKIDWRGKLYLAPLTTLGNLPFRLVCLGQGAEVTCGEMSMASSLLQGQKAEWALVRRHAREKLFGVQICGNNQYVMTKCAQFLQETAEVDFIDINMGCPLDFVHDQGSGSGLLRRENMVTNILRCMKRVMEIPLTVKTRTGVSSGKNTAHNLVPVFRKEGVSMITVHGRSREQRYSKNADWDYVESCAKLACDVPVFGNGDILSFSDYEKAFERCPSIAGAMIARGALIKPWIFREIKERRHIDISSGERFELIKEFSNYGLEHWGSDTRGVETTRRFLLEWLSFLYRYVPVGLLECPPQAINARPPRYRGRDDLETLMASPSCQDWIKLSEMLLGPTPDGFTFLPKHKANAWTEVTSTAPAGQAAPPSAVVALV